MGKLNQKKAMLARNGDGCISRIRSDSYMIYNKNHPKLILSQITISFYGEIDAGNTSHTITD